MSIKNSINRALRHAKVQGLTVGEIYDNIMTAIDRGENITHAEYSSVRARVYEMRFKGELYCTGQRKDRVSGKYACTFRRP